MTVFDGITLADALLRSDLFGRYQFDISCVNVNLLTGTLSCA